MSDNPSQAGSSANLVAATPPSTTAAILGASSNGWSPLRTSKQRPTSTVSYSQPSPDHHEHEEHPSLHSPKKQTQNFKSLRNHGLVSNSIFKQIDGGSPIASSPVASAARTQLPSPSVGLGIGVSASTSKPAHSPSRKIEDAENNNPFSLSPTMPVKGAQRKIPRKSLGRLHESNYVSNSVFRQQPAPADELGSPRSPPAASRALASASPSTSAATKGLLTSNRLHGPRFMHDSPQSSSADQATRADIPATMRRERRKTVTFDEILDVQEFDKESSFDTESLRDADEPHTATDAEDADFWTSDPASASAPGPLQVVNGGDAHGLSDDASEPDLSHDSHETSSVEEPPSPSPGDSSLQLQDLSVDEAMAGHEICQEDPVFSPERENSFARLSAADRVDSMMDELLRDDILSSPSMRARQAVPSPLAAQAQQSQPEVRLDAGALPQLPAWSPISFEADDHTSLFNDLNRSRTQPDIAPSPITAQPPASRDAPRMRPHISRDAILQRVAMQKLSRDQAQAQDAPLDDKAVEQAVQAATADAKLTRPNASQQKRMPRGSEPGPSATSAFAAETVQAKPMAASRPSAPPRPLMVEPVATEVKPAPAPSPVLPLDQRSSPLDLLGSELKETVELAGEPTIPTDANFAAPQLGHIDAGPADRVFADFAEPSAPQNEQAAAAPTHLTPAQQAEQIIARRRSKNGKARRKRSMSTGDARAVFTAASASEPSDEDSGSTSFVSETISESPEEQLELPTRQSISADLAKSKAMLDVSLQRAIEGGFQLNMEKELTRIYQKGESNYKVNDRGAFQGIDDKVTHSTTAGDVDSGKAWKKLRRPSDINDYKKEMRELREASNTRKASGKVFVMVDSFTPTDLPVPSRPTSFHCILDNGLHMVKTASVPLRPGRVTSNIAQEFELIQHKNLEFSLTLVVQRDAHLMEPQRPSSPTRREHGSPTLKGLSRFFSSPKKQAAKREQQEREAAAEMAAQAARAEPMLAYINREGAFGRTGVIFERVASQCYARCMVLDLPVHGVSNPTGSISGPSSIASRTHVSMLSQDFRQNLNKVRGTLRLKLFYLPPLPNIPRDGLPENLGECIRGIQHAAWHRADPWQAGTLTQLGGDCVSWRRRPVQAQGQYLICFNAVTKKPTVKIDLSKAVCIEELGNHVNGGSMIFPSAGSQALGRSKTMASYATSATLAEEEDADANYHVDRSFRITFADGERITFFADTEAQKTQWVKVISDVIANEVPPNPLWAQVLLEGIGAKAAQPERAVKTSQAFPSRKPVPTVEEEPSTPTQPLRHEADAVAKSEAREDRASRISTSTPQGATPSRLPIRAAHPVAASAPTSERGSMRGSPLPQRPASMIRTPVHDPSNRAAFDRLKRAGHLRAQTEDLTPQRRR
ncbi:hypothetical protein PaG_03419 [Moesziomyces aphidis]|uniref:PH domain-containing protein n=1 Tax=Moesziomyces aphidis TaxID=84754 RepID=W3VNI8_MOEAP|nr:hypothetical protein PaG_03419 [Moesziomyces aphidis]